MKKGSLIVIEGSDGAGKKTQAKALVKELSKKHRVAYFDFPRYRESLAGALVGRALAGEFGDFVAMFPEIASLPYILDRVSAIPKITKALSRGVVVCNRYTPSNAAYQSAKFSSGRKRSAFIKWLEKLEYRELGIPRPSLVIYLHVLLAVSQKFIAEKKKRPYLNNTKWRKDYHERNPSLQRAAIRQYRSLAATRPDWIEITCAPRGKMRSVESIRKEIRQAVSRRLKL
ncbi:hypothetical protein A3D66_01550 [Candidatus Kaiserbacteria bacterium RIFCSPHIGHO2_02_FULL_50_9]|uniref:Thymidylate kinase-like domain-containing protein n=1 Tax=Candidatus Kaiserbacteria bacterium RIFCSPLOWO2_01_FULL_51_21 TaxID=1798508 RepID=A0A1F6ED73_9BACT|nr:MAG: hypothetical protein A2761_02240 [Candidatus Kaiserbacteria bacterium RIFCSPHIGHO2_01_FULL_51_33]OGG63777.1 MAG: hypothetical protein A3D66_01550 [Candidatus Kaiserbacteria bacterium RIFCSPHIGHO2_02_FULL_50_9]OGG71609.1 MAG: hypothetical protein A3A35_00330 [Candidatus Kaiserbacteria bacterium RIFCSPLOWO2_01_FULL_51_21]